MKFHKCEVNSINLKEKNMVQAAIALERFNIKINSKF
jgi:hypothetical protein